MREGAGLGPGVGRKRGVCHLCICVYDYVITYVRDFLTGGSQSLSGEQERGLSGCGHTMSLVSSRQYSLILSKRYFFLSSESPGGGIGGGLSLADGDHTPLSKHRSSSSAVAVFLRKTTPGWSRSKRK